jgi:hypothetical protein
MTKIHRLLLVLFLFSTQFVNGQSLLTGSVSDKDDNSALSGVNIIITSFLDSTQTLGGITDNSGYFSIKVPPRGRYKVVFKFIGYDFYSTMFSATGEIVNLGKIQLSQNVNSLKTAVIEKKIDPIAQKNDTTEFNARAFKVNPDANAEDLIKKMPGITQENGTIKSQGEEVKKVLVDGREFFGDDAALALKSLPAEVIDKIQVFDRMSDQSRFTGFDDGNSQKTINILTKPGMSNGQFGKLYAGYGTDNTYESGLNLNYFKGSRRLSLIGMSNNVNQQNFSSQDLLGVFGSTGQRRGGPGGGGGRPGGYGGGGSNADPSSFLIGQQGGINKTTSTGINYSDVWGKKVTMNASYFFNYADNIYKNDLNRQYFVGDGESQIYNETTNNNTQNLNHRFTFRMEYTIDSSNSIIFNPKLNLQNAQLDNLLLGATTISGNPISDIFTKNNSENLALSGSSMLMWMHKMKKLGRTISIQLNNDLSTANNDAFLKSTNTYLTQTEILNQNATTNNNGLTNGINISYTEPLGKNTQLQLSYSPSINYNNSNKNTMNYDSSVAKYSILDSLLSNEFDNQIITQRLGGHYRYRGDKYDFFFGLNFQHVQLKAKQNFPNQLEINKPFLNLLPMGMFRYSFSSARNIRIFTRSFTQTPQLSQLQNVVNNSNPLLLSTGNPNLKQQTSYMLATRYSAANMAKSTSFFVYINATYGNNYIANSSLIAANDTLLANEILLQRGSQLSSYVNLDGYWNVRSFFTYALPLKKPKSNLNINWGATYNRTPGSINGRINLANTYNVNAGLVWGSNISKELDFTLSYTANYNFVFNSILPEQNNNYLTQLSTLKINWLPWKGLVLTSDLTNSTYSGLTATFNQQIWLWNAGIGYKFLKNKTAEVRLIAFDILKQNRSINRTVYETYIEDTNTSVLQQYFMVTMIYNIRNFGKPVKKTVQPN